MTKAEVDSGDRPAEIGLWRDCAFISLPAVIPSEAGFSGGKVVLEGRVLILAAFREGLLKFSELDFSCDTSAARLDDNGDRVSTLAGAL